MEQSSLLCACAFDRDTTTNVLFFSALRRLETRYTPVHYPGGARLYRSIASTPIDRP